MKNNDILKRRWEDIDKILSSFFKKYNYLDDIVKDEIQNVLDGINYSFNLLNNSLNKDEKAKLIRLYSKWKNEGIMTSYFSYRVQRAIANIKTTKLDMINLMIEAILLKRDKELNETQLFDEISNVATVQATKEALEVKKAININKTPKIMLKSIITAILITPNGLGNIWEDWRQGNTNYTAQQITKAIIVDLQQSRTLKISNYENILEKSQKRYLNLKSDNKQIDKFSGMLDDTITRIANSVIEQTYLNLGIKRVRFVAVLDKNTSKMCRSLDNQIFEIGKENKFVRYSAELNDDKEYRVIGLVEGINMPPITDHWHPCRSTIIAYK